LHLSVPVKARGAHLLVIYLSHLLVIYLSHLLLYYTCKCSSSTQACQGAVTHFVFLHPAVTHFVFLHPAVTVFLIYYSSTTPVYAATAPTAAPVYAAAYRARMYVCVCVRACVRACEMGRGRQCRFCFDSSCCYIWTFANRSRGFMGLEFVLNMFFRGVGAANLVWAVGHG
jgi:hypothetical protein